MSHPEFSIVRLDCIADTPRWNIHPFLGLEIPASLSQSFGKIGILHPPLLLELADGRHEIIDGRKRLQAVRKILNLNECPSLIVPQATPPQEVLSFLLASQSCCAPLSPMETAYFLKICGDYLTSEKIVNLFLSSLTGRSSISLLARYKRLLDLEYNLQNHVHHRFISEALAFELLQLKSEDRIQLTDLFSDFQMGGGKQRRFFSLARDIAMRKEISITSVLALPPLQEILQHRQMNAPQKVQNLLAVLQQMATPSVHGDEQSFKVRVSTLALPPSCTVVHSQAFETDEVCLSIRFENFNQLRMASAALLGTLKNIGLSDK